MKDNSAQRIAEMIFKFVDLENKQVIEIGCGDGRVTTFLAAKPGLLVAVDPDQKAIHEARQTIPGVDFRVGSGEHLPFADQSFDLVIFTLSLHHQNSKAALNEAVRVLKVSGDILVVEPLIHGEVERIFALVHNENQEKRDAQQAIQESGLKKEDCENFSATWWFDSKDDLCRSIFEYYDHPFDPETAKTMIDLLGSKSENRPIELLDQMVIQLLSKGGRGDNSYSTRS